MDLKFKDNSKLRIAPFTQLEYIDANGSCRIDTDIVVNYNTSVMQSIMQIDAFPSDQWLYSWIVGSSTSAFGLGWDSDSNADRPIKLYPGSSATSFNFPRNERHDIEVYIDNGGKLKYDGELILSNSAGAIIPNNSKFKFSFGGRLPFRYYRVCVKQSGVTVLDLYPVLDTRNVVCFYDVISETFFYNKGTGNFIAGPAVKQVLPETILLKTTTLYHENTPNVDGLRLLNSIINYQKTHQDEVKEYYYPTTQLWQDIITEYPDIVQYYNMNHKLCIPICEADDPEQCAQDFIQTIEDYPDIAVVIGENTSFIPIIAEYPDVVHSLIDTGYETVLTSSGTQYIDTGIIPDGTTKIECTFNVLQNTNSRNIFGCGYEWNNNAFAFGLVNSSTNYYYFTYNNTEFKDTNVQLRKTVILGNGIQPSVVFSAPRNLTLFAFNYDNLQIDSGLSFYSCKLYSSDNLILWLVPIQNNGNPCMIDLLTGTKYLNQGTGSFTYSLEPKNA